MVTITISTDRRFPRSSSEEADRDTKDNLEFGTWALHGGIVEIHYNGRQSMQQLNSQGFLDVANQCPSRWSGSLRLNHHKQVPPNTASCPGIAGTKNPTAQATLRSQTGFLRRVCYIKRESNSHLPRN